MHRSGNQIKLKTPPNTETHCTCLQDRSYTLYMSAGQVLHTVHVCRTGPTHCTCLQNRSYTLYMSAGQVLHTVHVCRTGLTHYTCLQDRSYTLYMSAGQVLHTVHVCGTGLTDTGCAGAHCSQTSDQAHIHQANCPHKFNSYLAHKQTIRLDPYPWRPNWKMIFIEN